MPRGYRQSRKDSNQLPGEKAFLNAGWSVSDVHSVGTRLIKKNGVVIGAAGALDLFVARCGVTILVEFKSGNAKLNDVETMFYDNWQGEKIIARDIVDALLDCEKILEKYIPY